MNTLYFNRYEFLQALSIANTNPLEAKRKYEEYLDKYPKDYNAYSYYISVLVTLQKFDEAKKVLEQIKSLILNDGHYLNQIDKIEKLKKGYLYAKLKLLMYDRKYKEAYKLCLKDFYKVDMNIESVKFYLEKKLNLIDSYEIQKFNYLKKQITNYSELEFLEHIKKHQADYNMNLDNPNNNIFMYDFNINQILEEIKKYIPSNNKICSGFFEDVYVFKYDECGREGNKIANYFKIICFHDTSEFITMCPIIKGENLPYIDLNYLKKEEPKVKVLSQTEKFYKRYKLK